MSSQITNRGAVQRPTLPPIHTLDLPWHTSAQSNVKYASYDNTRTSSFGDSMNKIHHDRKVSTSSSNTTVSRSCSPCSPNNAQEIPVFNHRVTITTPTKFRLVPCPMENAEAFVFIPPPSQAPMKPNYVARNGNEGGVLLVGPAMLQLRRNPQRALAKGARLHPYRIVRGQNSAASRRSSVVSVTNYPTSP